MVRRDSTMKKLMLLLLLVFFLIGCYKEKSIEKPVEPTPIQGQYKIANAIKDLELVAINETVYIKPALLSADLNKYLWLNNYEYCFPEPNKNAVIKATRTEMGFELEMKKEELSNLVLCKLKDVPGHSKHYPVMNVKFVEK